MTPLVDSSFKTKITAIQMFPDLLIAMEEKQTQLLKDAMSACENYDNWEKLLKKD
jgi:hypothetical protein